MSVRYVELPAKLRAEIWDIAQAHETRKEEAQRRFFEQQRQRAQLIVLMSKFILAPQAFENVRTQYLEGDMEPWDFEDAVGRLTPFLQEIDPLDELEDE